MTSSRIRSSSRSSSSGSCKLAARANPRNICQPDFDRFCSLSLNERNQKLNKKIRRCSSTLKLVDLVIQVLRRPFDLLRRTGLEPWSTTDVAFGRVSLMKYLADAQKRKVCGLGELDRHRRTTFLWPEVKALAGNTPLLENLVGLLKECAAENYPTISARSAQRDI